MVFYNIWNVLVQSYMHTIYIIINTTRDRSGLDTDGYAITEAQRSLVRNKGGLFHGVEIHEHS